MELSSKTSKFDNGSTDAATNQMNPHEQEEGDLAAQNTGGPALTQSEGVAQNNPLISNNKPPLVPPPHFLFPPLMSKVVPQG